MSNPSYGGYAIFGRSVSMETSTLPREVQENHYFGLTGTETLDGGGRGGKVTVAGILTAQTLPDLTTMWTTFESYQDGQTRQLVDTKGRVYQQVRLISFAQTGRLRSNGYGRFWQWYKAEFQVDQ